MRNVIILQSIFLLALLAAAFIFYFLGYTDWAITSVCAMFLITLLSSAGGD